MLADGNAPGDIFFTQRICVFTTISVLNMDVFANQIPASCQQPNHTIPRFAGTELRKDPQFS